MKHPPAVARSVAPRRLPYLALLVVAVAAVLIGGCQEAGLPIDRQATATEDHSAIFTQAAVTIAARLTLSAGETAIAQLTALAQRATSTPAAGSTPKASPTPEGFTGTLEPAGSDTPTRQPPTSTMAVLSSPMVQATPTPTPLPPTDTPTAIPPPPDTPTPTNTPPPTPTPTPTRPPTAVADCHRMEFLGDITAPPDSSFPVGSVFTKIWRVRNAGTCTWTRDYALAVTGGSLPANPSLVFLSTNVAPGQTVDLAVPVTAPAVTGVYENYWMISPLQGSLFGYGQQGSIPLLLRIRTYLPGYTQQTPFDLTAYACAAVWRSAAGRLVCPGNLQDADGVVAVLNSPALEGQVRSNSAGLLTRPNRDTDGWIQGEYPAYAVQNGDHFQAELGCQGLSSDDNPRCDVTFQLDFRANDGSTGTLGRWRETRDNFTNTVDLDLSLLSGRVVTFILRVTNNGNARQANAIWLQPRVQQYAPLNTVTLGWTRQGFPESNDCDGLRVVLTGPRTGTAQAFDCASNNRILGNASLTGEQADQLWSWVQRLANFEGETYTVTANHPVITWIDFRGVGVNNATEADIQAMNSYAASIFTQISR